MSDPAPSPSVAPITGQADTPIKPPTQPPAAISDRVKSFIGDLARPFALYSVSLATAEAIWRGAAADVIGAAGLILAALYAGKVVENVQQGKQQAQVAVAQANSNSASS